MILARTQAQRALRGVPSLLNRGSEIYVVNYIVDDAPKAHIRGYAFREESLSVG